MSVETRSTAAGATAAGATTASATAASASTASPSTETALLFGGQGERGLHEAVRRSLDAPLVELALQLAGCTPDMIFRDGGRLLEESRVLQPVLIALMLTDAERLTGTSISTAEPLIPDFAAGHSLGELAAWAWAGAYTAEEAVELAAARGRAMGHAARRRPGGMLALTDADDAALEHALAIGRRLGELWVGAYNAPREVVLTGTVPALEAVARLGGARRLPVEGAWHSPMMEEARVEFAAAVDAIIVKPLNCPVVSGVDGMCVWRAAEVTPRLSAQLTEPLRWTAALQTLTSLGAERFVIAGPGRVLRHLIRQNLPEADVVLE